MGLADLGIRGQVSSGVRRVRWLAEGTKSEDIWGTDDDGQKTVAGQQL